MLVLIKGRDWSVSRAPGSARYSPLPGTPFVHGCIRVVHGCIASVHDRKTFIRVHTCDSTLCIVWIGFMLIQLAVKKCIYHGLALI